MTHPTRTMTEHLLADDAIPEKTKGLLIDLTVLITDQVETLERVEKRYKTLSNQYRLLEKELDDLRAIVMQIHPKETVDLS